MAEVQGRWASGARLAIWLTLCTLGAVHGLVQWAFLPTIQTFCLTQLGVSLALGLAATVLRPDAGWTLGGLFLNLVLSVVAFYAGAAVMIAGFH